MHLARAPFVLLAILAACSSNTSDNGGGAGRTDDPGAGGGDTPSGDGGSGGDGTGTRPGETDTGGDGGGSDATVEEPARPYVAFDVNHVISTGQSNSVAHEGRPILSTTQPYANLMFDVGVMTTGTCEQQGCRSYQKPSSFVPLVEGDTFWYPVETMSSGLANQAAKLARERFAKPNHDLLVSLAGRNGLTYWCLRKGSCNYVDQGYLKSFDETMRQVADGQAIAKAAGKSYVVRLATSIHGESDDYGYAVNTPEFPLDGSDGGYRTVKDYKEALLEWQRDFETGVKEITAQTEPVPLLVSQFSGWNDKATSAVTIFQYQAHAESQGKVVLVAPGYFLEFASDCRHYTAASERKLGEYFGKAYARIVLEGKRWEPVRPIKVTRSGNTIVAKYAVPSPPLVLDTERVTNPGNYGFEAVDGETPIPVTDVKVTAPDTITVTLAAAPTPTTHLRYAYTHVVGTCVGPVTGARGNVRDSDPTPSQYGYDLFNWGVHFDVPVE